MPSAELAGVGEPWCQSGGRVGFFGVWVVASVVLVAVCAELSASVPGCSPGSKQGVGAQEAEIGMMLQKHVEPPGAGRGRRDPPLGPRREHSCADTLTLDFWPPDLWREYVSVVVSHPVFGTL